MKFPATPWFCLFPSSDVFRGWFLVISLWPFLLLLLWLLVSKSPPSGLRASQRRRRLHNAGAHGPAVGRRGWREAASRRAREEGAARRSGGLGGKSQPARGRRRLLGTRIFRGVGPAPERAYLARVAQAELRGLCEGPSAPGASPGHVYHPRVRSVISCLRSARSIRKNTYFGGFSENLGWSCPWVF